MIYFYDKAKNFVINTYSKQGKTKQIKHFLRTVDWVKELRHNADEALLIAALAHDIERGFRKQDMLKIYKKYHFNDKEFIRPHQERGAEIIADFLREANADNELIERVKYLVSRHEEGGDDDQNLLKDADSVSFFENNAKKFVRVLVVDEGKEKIHRKLDWMFNRITSEEAREFAKPFYEKYMGELEKYKNAKKQSKTTLLER